MTDFLAAEDRALLERHGLGTFDALWARQLDAVDEPNTAARWLEQRVSAGSGRSWLLPQAPEQLPDAHLACTVWRAEFCPGVSQHQPLSRSSAFRRCKAAFFGERKVDGEVRAILLTRALDGWDDLDSLLQRWSDLSEAQHSAILQACGQLARRLHGARQVHGCFYPKHIFLRATGDGYQAQLIDLEKTRPLLFGQRDRVKDLEPLLRRAPEWSEAQLRELLAAYLDQPQDSSLIDSWLTRLTARRSHKETR